VLDLGSGLPTQGHFNEWMPDGKILFSDYDPLTVEYGQDILKDRPNMRYVHADVRRPAELFATTAAFFGKERELAIGFIGLSYFLTDDEVRAIVVGLHDLCAPGSVMAVSYFLPVSDEGPTAEVRKAYMAALKVQGYLRTPDEMAALIAPWRVVEDGRLEELLATPDLLTETERDMNEFKGCGLFAVY
jgi:O-methyltransferase involved in polyketide biosynthesis